MRNILFWGAGYLFWGCDDQPTPPPAGQDAVESYQSAEVFARTTSGGRQDSVTYDAVDASARRVRCQVSRIPLVHTGTQQSAPNFLAALRTDFTGSWSFGWGPVISASSFVIMTYTARKDGPRVGAEMHVRYQPRSSEPRANVVWIQLVETEHPAALTTHVSPRLRKIDYPGTRRLPGTPYYDGTASYGDCSAGCDFYDWSYRSDGYQRHDWAAELRLATGPARLASAGAVQLLRPGLRWGWTTRCEPLANVAGAQWVIAGNAALLGEGTWTEQVLLGLESPVVFEARFNNLESEVQLLALQLLLGADAPSDPAFPLTEEGEAVTLQVAAGSEGRFEAYEFGDGSPAPQQFSIDGGQAVYQSASGEVAIEADITLLHPDGRMTPGTLALRGLLDAETNRLELGAATYLIENLQ